jgi:steroid 5-alpha reductase family enzyme
MMMGLKLVFFALVLNLGLMALCFVFAKRKNFYSAVDALWAFCMPLTAALYGLLGEVSGVRWAVLLLPPLFWGGRLGLHLASRLWAHFPQEDGRYVRLREEYLAEGRSVERGFFRFYLYQGISVVLLSAPFLAMACNSSAELGVFERMGAMIWGVGFLGEAIADLQMKRFRRQNPGKTCDVGLWRYSRHPNYFFESVLWWGYFLMAVGSPGGWITIYCPLLMLFLLLRVTGVPFAEAQSLKSRGEEFRAYQRRTSVFVPWFPRG